jgi:hypothetical protein
LEPPPASTTPAKKTNKVNKERMYSVAVTVTVTAIVTGSIGSIGSIGNVAESVLDNNVNLVRDLGTMAPYVSMGFLTLYLLFKRKATHPQKPGGKSQKTNRRHRERHSELLSPRSKL